MKNFTTNIFKTLGAGVFSLAIFVFLSSTAVQAKLGTSVPQLVVGQKVTITNSYQVTPMSGTERCTLAGGQTTTCSFTTEIWFWRGGFRYKKASIISNDDHSITIIVPDMPDGSNYVAALEHEEGNGIFAIAGDNRTVNLKLTHPAAPSSKPTSTPTPSPSASPTPEMSPGVTPVPQADGTQQPISTPAASSTPAPAPAKENSDANAKPKNLWQSIIFPIQRWWQKVFGKK